MKKAFYLLLVIMFVSCSKELNEEYDNVPRGTSCLEFDTPEDFLDIYSYLSSINYTELMKWVKLNNESSVLSASENNNNSSIKNTPIAFQALFNENLEVKIDNSIVKYCNGELLIITYENGQISTKEYGAAKYDDIPSINLITRNHSGSLKPDDKQSSRQHEFRINANNYQYKYVHQMRSFVVRILSNIRCVLTLDVKMEYRNSGSWKPAGRARTVELNLNGWHSWKGDRREFTLKTKNPESLSEGNVTYHIATIDVTSLYLGETVWSFDFSGTITQEIVGSPESRWTDTF